MPERSRAFSGLALAVCGAFALGQSRPALADDDLIYYPRLKVGAWELSCGELDARWATCHLSRTISLNAPVHPATVDFTAKAVTVFFPPTCENSGKSVRQEIPYLTKPDAAILREVLAAVASHYGKCGSDDIYAVGDQFSDILAYALRIARSRLDRRGEGRHDRPQAIPKRG